MKFYLILLASVLCLFSCGSTGKNVKNTNSQFSALQKKMIMGAAAEMPMRVWKITSKEDSILLRQQSENLSFDKDLDVIRTLSDRLVATVRDSASMGVGIAAPQVGILKNMIVVQRFDKAEFPFETIVNPVIVEYSEEKQPCPEGCLSIPDKQAVTKNRAKSIVLKYQNLQGEDITETVESFTAVVFQHEIDHLNGILFIDHLEEEVNGK